MYEPALPPQNNLLLTSTPAISKVNCNSPPPLLGHGCTGQPWVPHVATQKRTELDRHMSIELSPCKTKKHYKPKNKQKKHQNKNRKLHKNHKQKQKTSTAGGQLISSWTIGNEMITLYHLRDWYDNVKQEKQTAKCHTTIFFSVQRLHSFRQVV